MLLRGQPVHIWGKGKGYMQRTTFPIGMISPAIFEAEVAGITLQRCPDALAVVLDARVPVAVLAKVVVPVSWFYRVFELILYKS